MKNPQQINTAPLNRAADLFKDKSWNPSKAALKTARELNAPHVAEIHIVGGGHGADAVGELFKACGWLVQYHADEKEYGKHNKKVVKGSRRRVQPRPVCKQKGSRRRPKV